MTAIQKLQNEVGCFQASRFPKQTVKSKLNHLKREVTEAKRKPDDLSEWADIFILFLGASKVQGFTTGQIMNAAHAKMQINWLRKWGKPDRHGVYHHTK